MNVPDQIIKGRAGLGFVRFHVRSFRRGLPILRAAGAYEEIEQALASITTEEVEARRDELQATSKQKVGIQRGLNEIIKRKLADERDWAAEVAVFPADPGSRKGVWTMDFVKSFEHDIRVGLEVTFNHAEAIPWTILRPTLAHEADQVLSDARIHVGVIVIGTDHLKGNRTEGLRMDSAVGTFERLMTVLPKMRSVVPTPFVVFALDWDDGGLESEPQEVDLHRSDSGLEAWG